MPKRDLALRGNDLREERKIALYFVVFGITHRELVVAFNSQQFNDLLCVVSGVLFETVQVQRPYTCSCDHQENGVSNILVVMWFDKRISLCLAT